MSNFKPTAEQDAIYNAVEAGHDVVAAAGAGAGKTSTIIGIANRLDKPGMLIAFNKAIVSDAAPKLKGTKTTAKTAHSLAFAWMVRQPGLKQRFDAPRPDFRQVRSFINAQAFNLDDEHVIKVGQIVSMVRQSHRNYCNSADATLTAYHVHRTFPELPEGVDPSRLLDYILPMAQRYSADAMSVSGLMDFGFDEMLKAYQLSDPQLPVGWIGYDEAQDANPVILSIVNNQKCQRIVVGDSNQQIYEWRGAVDAMERFSAQDGVKTLGLTQSFRFGEAIADIANQFLTVLDSKINGQPFRIKGFDKINSTVGAVEKPNAVLCRSNAGTLDEAISYLENGVKVAIVGGGQDIRSFAQGARDLQLDGSTKHPDLAAFNSWDEVLMHAEGDEADPSFKRLVTLISKLGVATILDVLSSLVEENEAEVTISTAHKAKGREWDTVRIASDFRAPEEGQEPSKSELRLAYVAVTRAKLQLDLGGLAWINTIA